LAIKDQYKIMQIEIPVFWIFRQPRYGGKELGPICTAPEQHCSNARKEEMGFPSWMEGTGKKKE